jgi:hypothetical protein
MSYSVLVDAASKTAAAVGVLLGLAYVAGFFKLLVFYGLLKANWVFELVDVQGFIKEGMPFVMLDVSLVLITYFFLADTDNKKNKSMSLVLVPVTSIVAGLSIASIFYDLVPLYYLAISAAVSVFFIGGTLLAIYLNQYIGGIKPAAKLSNVIGAIMLLLWGFPGLVSYVLADSIKRADSNVQEVVNDKGVVVGLLVGVVAGKFLIWDCELAYQMRMEEIKSDLSVRGASGKCRSIH